MSKELCTYFNRRLYRDIIDLYRFLCFGIVFVFVDDAHIHQVYFAFGQIWWEAKAMMMKTMKTMQSDPIQSREQCVRCNKLKWYTVRNSLLATKTHECITKFLYTCLLAVLYYFIFFVLFCECWFKAFMCSPQSFDQIKTNTRVMRQSDECIP